MLIQQRYNFESNSQQGQIAKERFRWCCLYSKDTISKAIHNLICMVLKFTNGVAYTAKIQFRKQFTTLIKMQSQWIKVLLIQQRYNFESNSQQKAVTGRTLSGCCLYSKDTISKAIHNEAILINKLTLGVAYTAKIQFRKQFTTQR